MNPLLSLPRTIKIILCAIAVLLVASLWANLSMYFKIRAIEHPEIASEAELKKTVEDVGELMVLPESENPTLATVSDPEKLKDQPFFVNAEVGDKVLVYSISRKAILWRPSTKKIIEVSSLNTSAPGQTVPSSN